MSFATLRFDCLKPLCFNYLHGMLQSSTAVQTMATFVHGLCQRTHELSPPTRRKLAAGITDGYLARVHLKSQDCIDSNAFSRCFRGRPPGSA